MATAALVAVAATGCAAAGERLSEAATERVISSAAGEGVEVDLDGGQVTITDEDGTALTGGTSTEVPQRLADEVPLPDGFTAVSSYEQTSDGETTVTVMGTSPGEDPIAVGDAYVATLEADGWERSTRSDLDGQMLSAGLARGEDSLVLGVVGSDADEGVGVTLTIVLDDAS